MGQVPSLGTPLLGIVGDGRVARHFHHYFDLLNLPVRRWTRRSDCDPVEALAPCGTVMVLISDAAIEPFIAAWPALAAHRLVHCSGALATPSAECAHPLMTFGPDLYDLPAYQQIPFVLDAGRTRFAELLPGLPNPSFTIDAAERPAYHAHCVMAGNFTTLLWRKLFDLLEDRLGIPAEAAHPFLTRTVQNLIADPGRALTGPLARGDAATIAANLAALDGDPFAGIYSAFARAYARSR
jgi:2-dehydropantoate 2-reductase